MWILGLKGLRNSTIVLDYWTGVFRSPAWLLLIGAN